MAAPDGEKERGKREGGRETDPHPCLPESRVREGRETNGEGTARPLHFLGMQQGAGYLLLSSFSPLPTSQHRLRAMKFE